MVRCEALSSILHVSIFLTSLINLILIENKRFCLPYDARITLTSHLLRENVWRLSS